MLNSLKYRISGSIFILVAIMLSLVIWQTLSSAFQQNEQNIEIVKNTSQTLMKQTARTALFSEEYDTMQFRIESIIDNPHIKHIFLVDYRNIIVASDRFEQLGSIIKPVQNDEDSYWERLEISNSTGNMGSLYMQYSFANITENNHSILIRGFTIAAAGTFIIAAISLFLGQLLTRRLQVLSQVAEDISRGDFHGRTNLKGNDEISRLSHTFDNMAQRIEEKQNSLAELNQNLEQRIAERTNDYENANRELEAFCHSVSHDLRAPLRAIEGFSHALEEDYADSLDANANNYLNRVIKNTQHMSDLIDSLLKLSRINQQTLNIVPLNLSKICHEIIERLEDQQSKRDIEIIIADDIHAHADKQLITIALENLLGNAWKYTQKLTGKAVIEFACSTESGREIYYIRDNGAGFDMRYADQLFAAFKRLHNETEFDGTGIGLSTVQRIIYRHGGVIWAESMPDHGSCFFFTLGETNHYKESGLNIQSFRL